MAEHSILTISLKEFALMGEFGPVKIGMTKDQVIDLLGKPDNDVDFGMTFSGGVGKIDPPLLF